MSDAQDLTARYQLKQLLNWTGSARTFRGSHPSSGEPVAVKLLSISRAPGAFELGRRFENLARVLQALSHPSLPRVVEFGLTSTGDGFLVTRWIEGKPLSTDRTLEPAELLPLLLQGIEALETVTLHGVAHLNISPDNLLLQEDGVLRILGWGTSLLTVDWQVSPTEQVDAGPANPWGAPELLRQLAPGDALWRADLYSVALIAVTLLGARLEERSAPAPSVRFDKGLSGRLKQPEQLRAQLELCLRRDPAERPDTFAELARAIQHAMPRGAVALDTQPVEKIEKVGASGRAPAQPQAPQPEAPTQAEIAAQPRAMPPKKPATQPELDPNRATTVLPRPDVPARAAPPVEGSERPGQAPAAAGAAVGPGGSDRRVVLPAAAADVTGIRRPVRPPSAPPPSGPPSAGPPPAADPPPAAPPATPPANRADATPPASGPPASPARPDSRPAPPPPGRPPSTAAGGASASAPAGPRSAAQPTRSELGRESPPPPRAPAAATKASPAASAVPTPASASPSPPTAPTGAVTAPVPPPTGGGSPMPSGRASEGGVSPLLWLAVAAVAFLFVVGAAVAGVFWLRSRSAAPREVVVEQSPVELASPVEVIPEDAPPVPLPDLLEQALIQIADGKLLDARATLEELSDLEEEGSLPSEVSLAYYSVLETLRRARAEEVTGQLRDGLRRYDLALLNRTLRAMNGEEERMVAATDEGVRRLNRARAVLSTANSLNQALREGRLVDALEGANRLEQDDPELSAALDLRARAAEQIEQEIDELIAADRMEQADQRLRELERLWPGRFGSADRRKTIDGRLQSIERYESLLASIAATGEEGRPHEGLEMIAALEVPAEYRERLAQLEQKLQAQLLDLDREAPTIQLVEEDPEYRRNRPVVLEFQVADDYEVRDFTLHARRANDSTYEDVDLEALGDGRYRAELSPSFHDNKPILFWAEAGDRLGNVTRFASPGSPEELRRGRRRR